jgi:hypothetical protein
MPLTLVLLIVYFIVSIFWVPSFILVYVDIIRGDTE